MIFGDYPCCGGALAIAMPKNRIGVLPESCPHCGVKVWHILSRINPTSYVDQEFLKLYEVDDQRKTVKRRSK